MFPLTPAIFHGGERAKMKAFTRRRIICVIVEVCENSLGHFEGISSVFYVIGKETAGATGGIENGDSTDSLL